MFYFVIYFLRSLSWAEAPISVLVNSFVTKMDSVARRSVELAHRYAEFVQGSLRSEKLSSRYCVGCGRTGLSGGLRRHLEAECYRHISSDKRSTKCVCGRAFWYETGYDKFLLYHHLFDCVTSGKKTRSKGMMAAEASMEAFRAQNASIVFGTPGTPEQDDDETSVPVNEEEATVVPSFVPSTAVRPAKRTRRVSTDSSSGEIDPYRELAIMVDGVRAAVDECYKCVDLFLQTSKVRDDGDDDRVVTALRSVAFLRASMERFCSRVTDDCRGESNDQNDDDDDAIVDEGEKSVYVGDVLDRLTDQIHRNSTDFRGRRNAKANRRHNEYARLDKKLYGCVNESSTSDRSIYSVKIDCVFCEKKIPFTRRIVHGSKVHGSTGVVGGSNRRAVGLLCVSCGLRFVYVEVSSPFYSWFRFHVACCALSKALNRTVDPLTDASLSDWLSEFDDKTNRFGRATVRDNREWYLRFVAETTLPKGGVRPVVSRFGEFRSEYLGVWYERLRDKPKSIDRESLAPYFSIMRNLNCELRTTAVDWDGCSRLPSNVIVRSFSEHGTVGYTCEPEIERMLERSREERSVTKRLLAERFRDHDWYFEASARSRPRWLETAIVCDPTENDGKPYKLTYDSSIDDRIFDRSSCGLDMWLLHLSMFLQPAKFRSQSAKMIPASSPVFVHMFIFCPAHDEMMCELFNKPDDYYVLPNTCLCVNPVRPSDCTTSMNDDEWELDPRNCHRHAIVVFRDTRRFKAFGAKFSASNIGFRESLLEAEPSSARTDRLVGNNSDDELPGPSTSKRNDRSKDSKIRAKIKYSRRLVTRMHFRNTVNYVSRGKGSISMRELFGGSSCNDDDIDQQRDQVGGSIMKQFHMDGSRIVAKKKKSRRPVKRPRREKDEEDYDDDDDEDDRCALGEEESSVAGDEGDGDELDVAEIKESHGEESYHFCISSPVCGHFRNLSHLVSRRGCDEVLSDLKASDSLFLRLVASMSRTDGTVALLDMADALCGGREYVLRSHLLPLTMYTARFDEGRNDSFSAITVVCMFDRLIEYLGNDFFPDWLADNLAGLHRTISFDTNSSLRAIYESFVDDSPLLAMDDFTHIRARLPDRLLVDMHRVNLFSGRLLDRYVDHVSSFENTLRMIRECMRLELSVGRASDRDNDLSSA